MGSCRTDPRGAVARGCPRRWPAGRSTGAGVFALATLLGFGSSACSLRTQAPLTQLEPAEVMLQVGFSDGAGPVGVTVNVVSMAASCAGVTDDAWVEVAGQRLDAYQRGGPGATQGGQTFCDPAIFKGSFPTDDAAEVVVQVGDASAIWTVKVVRMLAARHLVMTQPADGHLQRGVEATFTVGEPTDGTATGMLWFVRAGQADGTSAFLFPLDPAYTTVVGTSVSFVVPQTAPISAGTLEFGGNLSPTIAACTGPSTCWISIGGTLTAAVSIDS